MPAAKWTAFPYAAADFNYEGKSLAAHWAALHRGDCEPYPTAKSLADRTARASSDDSVQDIVAAVQDAWRAYHAGEFRRAFDEGTKIGLPGFAVSIKAAGVYASYLEKNKKRAEALLSASSQRAEEAIALLPSDPNAHYLYAYTLGRYSQHVSILEALTQGLARKIEHALQTALRLEPKHAEAHTALGVYNAEIVGALGALAAGFTYGASSEKAIEHFKKAVKLNPDAAICKLEYAHGLRLIDRDAHDSEIARLLSEASKCKAIDAAAELDSVRAKTLLGKSTA